jgi:hypothetical protein
VVLRVQAVCDSPWPLANAREREYTAKYKTFQPFADIHGLALWSAAVVVDRAQSAPAVSLITRPYKRAVTRLRDYSDTIYCQRHCARFARCRVRFDGPLARGLLDYALK